VDHLLLCNSVFSTVASRVKFKRLINIDIFTNYLNRLNNKRTDDENIL